MSALVLLSLGALINGPAILSSRAGAAPTVRMGVAPHPKIANCITDLIGNTPLLKLSRSVADAPGATIVRGAELSNPVPYSL